MIPVKPAPAPPDFEERVAQRGLAWLQDHPTLPAGRRPPSYWTACVGALRDAFASRCGYAAMYEPVGTVDHFVSWSEDRGRAYDWANYRLASGWINSSKQHLSHREVLDPFVVEEGWFEVLLPSLQLVLTDRIPQVYRDRAQTMLERLHLGDDERIVRQRREWYRLYQEGRLTLEGLAEMAPLIAAAVRRQEQAR